MGFVRYNKSNIPCQCGYPDGMSPLGETFHHDTHTGMAYLYTVTPFQMVKLRHYVTVHQANLYIFPDLDTRLYNYVSLRVDLCLRLDRSDIFLFT